VSFRERLHLVQQLRGCLARVLHHRRVQQKSAAIYERTRGNTAPKTSWNARCFCRARRQDGAIKIKLAAKLHHIAGGPAEFCSNSSHKFAGESSRIAYRAAFPCPLRPADPRGFLRQCCDVRRNGKQDFAFENDLQFAVALLVEGKLRPVVLPGIVFDKSRSYTLGANRQSDAMSQLARRSDLAPAGWLRGF